MIPKMSKQEFEFLTMFAVGIHLATRRLDTTRDMLLILHGNLVGTYENAELKTFDLNLYNISSL